MSHDLRTPLRAIDGFSQILVKDYADKLDGEGRRILQVVRDGATRMGHLIDDILAFSRVGRQAIAGRGDRHGITGPGRAERACPAMADRAIEMRSGNCRTCTAIRYAATCLDEPAGQRHQVSPARSRTR